MTRDFGLDVPGRPRGCAAGARFGGTCSRLRPPLAEATVTLEGRRATAGRTTTPRRSSTCATSRGWPPAATTTRRSTSSCARGQPRPLGLRGLGGRGDARAASARPGEEHDAARAGADRARLPLHVRLHRRRPRDRQGAAARDRDASPASRSRPTTTSAASGSPSARRFETRSPIDEARARRGRAGGRRRGRPRRSAPPTTRSPPGPRSGRPAAPPHLHRLADLIDANVDRLAAVECADMAMLLRSLRARVIARGARNYRAYADLAVAYEERDWHSNGTWNRVQRMPAGPAAVITPWNAPFMLSTWKTAPALAAGCTVVLKPAEWSPLSCSLLADLARRGRPPAGRLQRRPGHRRGGRRGARRAPADPARLVHRLARDRAPHRRRRGRATSSRSPPSSAARTR